MTQDKGAAGAIIVAAGKGTRMGLGYNKVLAKIHGKSIIEWTIESFALSGLIGSLVIVINPEDEEAVIKVSEPYTIYFPITRVFGGTDRQDSVYNGLMALPHELDIILIHDGARPFIDRDIIEHSIQYASKFGAACAGMPVKDTIKIVDDKNIILSTPDRNRLWNAQTPQAFRREIIFVAYLNAIKKGIRGTDDAGLAEAAGYKVTMFKGSYKNIKITSGEDMLLAEQLMRKP